MAKVRVTALGEARVIAGWSSKEVDFERGNVRELLNQISSAQGKKLYEEITENDRLKGKFFIILNGSRQECAEVLNAGLKADDHLVIMEKVKIMG